MLKFLQNILNKSKPHFEKGGKLENLYPVFEATDTILFSTNEVTESGPHIRDSIDTKRIMILVVISLIPLYLFGAANVGYQNAAALDVERSVWQNFWVGFGKILPGNPLPNIWRSKLGGTGGSPPPPPARPYTPLLFDLRICVKGLSIRIFHSVYLPNSLDPF